MDCKRANKKWTITELIALEREYELLEMNVVEIAVRHKRSVTAIIYKLEAEGFIDSMTSARGCAKDIVAPHIASEDDTMNAISRLSIVESSISEIKDAINLLMSKFSMSTTNMKRSSSVSV
jgi:hypothetical protein